VLPVVDDQVLYRVEDAAKILALGRSRTYSLIKSHVLPSLVLAGSIRVSRRHLEEWIEREIQRQAVER
jgi:excisionase family DNA binding protein